jgi:hypothetical protein
MEGVRITAGKNKTTRVRFTLPEPDSNEPVILTDLSSEWRTELRQRFVAESTRRRGGEKVVLTCDPAAPLPAASIPPGLQMPTADQLNVVWKAAEDGGVACHYQAPEVARQHIESKPAPPATAPPQGKVENAADDVSVPAKATQKSSESKDAAPEEDRTAPSATAETSSIPATQRIRSRHRSRRCRRPSRKQHRHHRRRNRRQTAVRRLPNPQQRSRWVRHHPRNLTLRPTPHAASQHHPRNRLRCAAAPSTTNPRKVPEAKRDEHPKPREESAPSATSSNATSAGQPAVAVTKTEPAPAPTASEPAVVQPQPEQDLQPQPEPPAESRATSSQPAATVAMRHQRAHDVAYGCHCQHRPRNRLRCDCGQSPHRGVAFTGYSGSISPRAPSAANAASESAPEAKRDEHPKPREEPAPSATSSNATSAGQPAVAVTKTEPAPAPAAAEPAAVQPQTEQGLQPQPEPRAEPIPPAAQQHGRAETSVTGASTSTLLVTVAGGDALESQPSLVIAAAKAPAFHDDRVVLQSSVRGLLARRLEPPLLVSFVSGKRLPMIHFAESLQKEERAFRAAHPTLDHDSRWMRFDDTPPRVSIDSAAMNREAAKYNTEATKVFNARQRAMPRNVRFGSVS